MEAWPDVDAARGPALPVDRPRHPSRPLGMLAPMDSLGRVRAALEAHDRVLATEDLDRLGLSAAAIRQLVARGELHRYRRSAFIDGHLWRAAPPWERHALRARAVARSLDLPAGPYLLSHHSALVLHGVGVFGVDDLVHLVRTDGGRGRKDGTVHVHAPVPPSFAAPPHATPSGLPTVTVAHACAQVAAAFGTEAGLVSADAALRQELTSPAALVRAAQDVTGRDASRVHDAMQLADGRSGSAGESRTRWLLHWLAMPLPELQAVIRDASGDLVAITDFLFRDQWTVVEFNGALKYATPAGLVAEKLREDRLRELGYEVVRVTWADLEHPARVVARIRAAFVRAQTRRARAA